MLSAPISRIAGSAVFPTGAGHNASTLVAGWYGPERDMFGEYRWFDVEAEVEVVAARPWRTVSITGRFTEFVNLGCAVSIRPAEEDGTWPADDLVRGVLEPGGHGWTTWRLRCDARQPAGRYVVRFESLQTWRDVSRRNISVAVSRVGLR